VKNVFRALKNALRRTGKPADNCARKPDLIERVQAIIASAKDNPAKDNSPDFGPTACEACGGVNFIPVDTKIGHAILEDGNREYWLTATGKCAGCGAVYIADGEMRGTDTFKDKWRRVTPK